MYKILINFYLNFVSLRLRDRFRRYNIISIILELHESKFENIISVLRDLRLLNREINLNINDEMKFVYAYILAFIEDIS